MKKHRFLFPASLMALVLLGCMAVVSCANNFKHVPQTGFITHQVKNKDSHIPFDAYWNADDKKIWNDRVNGVDGKKVLMAVVPAPVKEQVQKQYPNAGAIEWDFDNDEDVYEAEFHLNGLEYEVKLYPDGTVSLVKADISLQHLPAPVTAAIARDFPGYALRRARQITARGVLKYRVDCRSESPAVRKVELYYSPDGKLLSQKTDD